MGRHDYREHAAADPRQHEAGSACPKLRSCPVRHERPQPPPIRRIPRRRDRLDHRRARPSQSAHPPPPHAGAATARPAPRTGCASLTSLPTEYDRSGALYLFRAFYLRSIAPRTEGVMRVRSNPRDKRAEMPPSETSRPTRGAELVEFTEQNPPVVPVAGSNSKPPDRSRGLINTKRLGLAVASCALTGAAAATVASAQSSGYGWQKLARSVSRRGHDMVTGSSNSAHNRARNIYGHTIVIQAFYYSPSHYGHSHAYPNGQQGSSHFSHKGGASVFGRCWNGTYGSELNSMH